MKAVALISSGLDSILAAKLMKEQDIEVTPLNFKTPFGVRKQDTQGKVHNFIQQVVDNIGIELKTIDISDDFLNMLKNPRYGFGSNMNPCIDCKILMLKKAKEIMTKMGASFIATGEILGQRPMSQNRPALELIEKRAGLTGLLLRPLSAKLLAETIPEKEGWVDRNKLLDFNGRGRRPQIELAKKFGIKEYAQPAGGCLLTDPEFSRRLKELVSHKDLSLGNVELLKVGRHFRLSDKAKLVVGRDEKENAALANLAKENDYLFLPTDEMAGPTSLGRGIFDEELVRLSCEITCRYCDLDGKAGTEIVYSKFFDKGKKLIKVLPLEEVRLISLRL